VVLKVEVARMEKEVAKAEEAVKAEATGAGCGTPTYSHPFGICRYCTDTLL